MAADSRYIHPPWEFMRAFDLPTVLQLAQFYVAAFAETGQLKDQAGFLDTLRSFRDPCEALGLTSTLRQLDRVIERLERVDPGDGPTAKWKAIQPDMQQLGVRFQEETEATVAFSLPESDYRLYESPTADWQDILASFPSALTDVEEMNRCLALGRYTASVYHAMCVLERGVSAFAVEFKTSTAMRTWQHVLDKLRKAVEARSLSDSKWKDGEFFADAARQLFFFKDVWRNHVMHGRASFSEETARAVVEAVRHFMAHLATKLSEVAP